MKQHLRVLTAIVGIACAVSVYGDQCFDTYEAEGGSDSEKPRPFRTVMNGDGSVCAIYQTTKNSDSLVRLEILDGQGRLRYIKTYHYEADNLDRREPDLVEMRYADGQLFWRWTSESKIYQFPDGRKLDGCTLFKKYPMFYWGNRTMEIQERACQVEN